MAAAVLELRDRAARDPLTGLGHHATFYDALPHAAPAAGARCALLIADVDGFKEINDTRGHAAGDDVLRAMAGLLRAAAPSGGRAFRIGGDEFALVFECDGEAQAEQVGWQLRTQARDQLGSTVSVGLALADRGESRRGHGGARRLRALRGQARRVATASGSRRRHHKPERPRLHGHPLEPAAADLAVDVDLGAAREIDLDHPPARVLDAALLRDRVRAQAPGAAGEAGARAGREHHDVERAVLRIGLGDARAAAERAADRDDRLPAVARRRRSGRRPAPSTRSGCAAAAARTAPTP